MSDFEGNMSDFEGNMSDFEGNMSELGWETPKIIDDFREGKGKGKGNIRRREDRKAWPGGHRCRIDAANAARLRPCFVRVFGIERNIAR